MRPHGTHRLKEIELLLEFWVLKDDPSVQRQINAGRMRLDSMRAAEDGVKTYFEAASAPSRVVIFSRSSLTLGSSITAYETSH